MNTYIYIYVYLQLFSFLPEPVPEDLYLDNLKTGKLFNKNVLWTFEGLKMLVGTDLPILKSGDNSRQSLGLRYNIYFKLIFKNFILNS